MKIISVIPLKKGVLKADLTYFTSLPIAVGNIVTVPIRNKKTLAFVTSVEELREEKSSVKGMNFNLKKVTEDKGASVFLAQFLETIFDTSMYFAQPKNSAVASLIPNIFIEEYDKIVKIKTPLAEIKKPKEDVVKSIFGARPGLRAEKLLLQANLEERISTYKTLVRESFAKGKSVFMVLPTELDIDKFTEHLSKGIEQFTFAVHSGIPAKKNLLSYEKIITSSHPVLIIGTAPFLSIPKADIGTIILEHESSSAYRMMRRPHFDLRIFTEIFASKINAKFIMADELFRFETIGRKDIDNLNALHQLSFRVEFEGRIEILGKNEKEHGEKFHVLKKESVDEIKSSLRNKKSVFIFSLRKGLATMTVCRDCSEVISCKTCGAPLVLYTSHQGTQRTFICNRCERDEGGDKLCTACGSWNLMPLGIGTDTVHEYVKEIMYEHRDFPKANIFKMDKESITTASMARKIIKEFEETPGSILIGTEMAFFYLQKKVPLSVLASFDSLWSIPNFKMSEKIIQILLSIIHNTEDRVLIQTKNENDETIKAIKSGNLLNFIRSELEERKKLEYPPYKRFIKITHLGDKEQTLKARSYLEETFKEYTPEIFSGFVAKLQGKYVTNALIKIETKKWSLSSLSTSSTIDENLLNKLLTLPISFEIFIDPEDLL